MQAILAIDQSTSGTKAILFDTAGAVIDKVSLNHAQIYPQPGWVEHDPEEIYRNTLQAVREVLARNPHCADELLYCAITNQRETICVFERATGAPLHHAIVWQCRRSAALCEELKAQGAEPMVTEKTGLSIDPYFSASKLKWLLRQRPDIAAQLQNGQALIGTMDSYLIYRLTGGACLATDHTNACRTLLYDFARLQWDEELCALFDVPPCALPEIRESSAEFGATTFDGLLPRPLPIRGVMGDSQASLFAQRCYEPGSAKVTFGTGSSVLLTLGDGIQRSPNGIVTTLSWVLDGKPTYAFEGITNFTGATIAWLQNQLQLIQTPAETEALALAVEDNGGVYLVPAFVGMGAPYWASHARAAIVGLTPYSTKNHVARAALESISYSIRDVLVLMAQDAGMPLRFINADGGGVSNRFLMQFTADMLQIGVRASQQADLAALGAVYAGLLGSGLASSLADLASLPRSFDQYEPRMSRDQMQTLVDGWKAAVERVL